MANIEVKNNSDVKLLFSVFKEGDAKIPFHVEWVESREIKTMKIGDFPRVGVGAQTQKGGRWVSDPRTDPTFRRGEVCVLTITKTVG